MSLEISAMAAAALRYDAVMTETRERLDREATARGQAPVSWYQYGSLSNFQHLQNLLGSVDPMFFANLKAKRIADVGAADGDVAFFLETLGFEVDVVDNAPTNHNGLTGARALQEALSSSVTIHERDLDSQFQLPQDNYELVIFLGLLYHLKNPYYALERLSFSTRYCFVSTKVAKVTRSGTRLEAEPVAYLVAPYETNGDPTNFWVFSPAGLRRVVERTGWHVRAWMSAGFTGDSDPSSPDRDERIFCLLESSRTGAGPA